MQYYIAIAEQFITQGKVIDVREFGSCSIDDTFLVTTTNDEDRFVLQRINTHVFKQPKLIMRNMRAFTDHMRRRATEEQCHSIMPRVLSAQDGSDYYLDPEQNFWRAVSYVRGARSFDTVISLQHAREVGYALGMFQYLISDMQIEKLADTLLGCHITPQYLQDFDKAFSSDACFKVKHPEHNLLRALVQFKLTESIESHEHDIRSTIQGIVTRAA